MTDNTYLTAAQLVRDHTVRNMRRVLTPFEARIVVRIYDHLIRRAGENSNDRPYSE